MTVKLLSITSRITPLALRLRCHCSKHKDLFSSVVQLKYASVKRLFSMFSADCPVHKENCVAHLMI